MPNDGNSSHGLLARWAKKSGQTTCHEEITLMSHHFQQYFSPMVAVRFFLACTEWKLPTCLKLLTNFIQNKVISSTPYHGRESISQTVMVTKQSQPQLSLWNNLFTRMKKNILTIHYKIWQKQSQSLWRNSNIIAFNIYKDNKNISVCCVINDWNHFDTIISELLNRIEFFFSKVCCDQISI